MGMIVCIHQGLASTRSFLDVKLWSFRDPVYEFSSDWILMDVVEPSHAERRDRKQLLEVCKTVGRSERHNRFPQKRNFSTGCQRKTH